MCTCIIVHYHNVGTNSWFYNVSFSQVISYIILEEAEYRLRGAISSKEKVLPNCVMKCILQL